MNNSTPLVDTTRTTTLVAALWAGTVGGFVSSFVKWGTEIPFPPRTPDRISPPAQMLGDMGINSAQLSYTYSDHVIFWGPALIHIEFSLIFGIAYCVAAIKMPKITLWQGAAFGLLITILFHGVILPLGQWAPAIWNLPPEELISETFGHVLWSWTIEIIRRQFVIKPFQSRCA